MKLYLHTKCAPILNTSKSFHLYHIHNPGYNMVRHRLNNESIKHSTTWVGTGWHGLARVGTGWHGLARVVRFLEGQLVLIIIIAPVGYVATHQVFSTL